MKSIFLDIRLNTDFDFFKWHNVNWHTVTENVKRLQSRIVKAVKLGKSKKTIKSLQRLLSRSLSACLLAVKRVTGNSGSKTAGVDNEKWDTPNIVYKTHGGSDRLDNLVMLHLNCHKQIHYQKDSEVKHVIKA